MTPKPTKPNDEEVTLEELLHLAYQAGAYDDLPSNNLSYNKNVTEAAEKLKALITKREHLAGLRNEEELRFYRNLDVETGGLQPRKVKASHLWANYRQQLEEVEGKSTT